MASGDIEVNNSVANPEFPTRISIIAFDGTFVHAEDYTPPYYSFSVKVEAKYNRVIDGREENILTCTFWTAKDTAHFSWEDDELDEESVNDWFWEGLGEDLSNHDLEGLKDIDFYEMGVPVCDGDSLDVDEQIAGCLDECIPDKWKDFSVTYGELFEAAPTCPELSKETVVQEGNVRTVWSIEDFVMEDGYDSYCGDVINASYWLKGDMYIGDELLLSVEFKTEPSFLMDPCPNQYSAAVKVIMAPDSSFKLLVGLDHDMRGLSYLCKDYDSFTALLEEYGSLEEAVSDYIYSEFDVDSYEPDVTVTEGPLALKWLKQEKEEEL